MANKKNYFDGKIKEIRNTENLSTREREATLQNIYRDVCIHCKLNNYEIPPEIVKGIKEVSPNIELVKPNFPQLSHSPLSILPWVKEKQYVENKKRINLFDEVEKIDDPKKLVEKYIEKLEEAIRLKEKPNESLLHIIRSRFNDITIGKWGSHIDLRKIDYQRGIKNVIKQLKAKKALLEFLSAKYSTLYPNNTLEISNSTRAIIKKEIERLQSYGEWDASDEFCKWLTATDETISNGLGKETIVKKDTTISYAKHKSNVINDYVKKDHGI